MTKPQIKQLADYVKDLKEGLYEWDYDNIAMQVEVPELHRIIQLLMDATFRAKTTGKKVVLAMIEKGARECLSCIERRLSIKIERREDANSYNLYHIDIVSNSICHCCRQLIIAEITT